MDLYLRVLAGFTGVNQPGLEQAYSRVNELRFGAYIIRYAVV